MEEARCISPGAARDLALEDAHRMGLARAPPTILLQEAQRAPLEAV